MAVLIFVLSFVLLVAGLAGAYLSIDLVPTEPGLFYAFAGAVAVVGAIIAFALGILTVRVGRVIRASNEVLASRDIPGVVRQALAATRPVEAHDVDPDWPLRRPRRKRSRPRRRRTLKFCLERRARQKSKPSPSPRPKRTKRSGRSTRRARLATWMRFLLMRRASLPPRPRRPPGRRPGSADTRPPAPTTRFFQTARSRPRLKRARSRSARWETSSSS